MDAVSIERICSGENLVGEYCFLVLFDTPYSISADFRFVSGVNFLIRLLFREHWSILLLLGVFFGLVLTVDLDLVVLEPTGLSSIEALGSVVPDTATLVMLGLRTGG